MLDSTTLLVSITKAAHLLSAMAWIASLFALAALLPFHIQATHEAAKARLVEIEHFLLKKIANPLLLVVLVLGVASLVQNPVWLKMGWMHAKLLFVVFICGYHGALAKSRRVLAEGGEVSLGKARALNAVLWVLTAAIVFFVIVKPF